MNTETVFAALALELSWDVAEETTKTHDREIADVMTELADEYMPSVRWVEV